MAGVVSINEICMKETTGVNNLIKYFLKKALFLFNSKHNVNENQFLIYLNRIKKIIFIVPKWGNCEKNHT